VANIIEASWWWQALGGIATAITGIALAVFAYLTYRLSRKHQQFLKERDDYLYRPRLQVERRIVCPKMARAGPLIPKALGLLWEVGLHNAGEVPIFVRHHWVEFKGVETLASIPLPPFCYKLLDETERITNFPLEITRAKGEVVLKIFVDNPVAEEWIEKILGQQRTLKMSITIGYQVAGAKQYDLVATEVSEVFSFPMKPKFGDTTIDLVYE